MCITVLVREARWREQAVVHQAVCVCTLSYSVVLVCVRLTLHVCAPRYSVMLQFSVIDCLTLH
jgi:hypothetical protein